MGLNLIIYKEPGMCHYQVYDTTYDSETEFDAIGRCRNHHVGDVRIMDQDKCKPLLGK